MEGVGTWRTSLMAFSECPKRIFLSFFCVFCCFTSWSTLKTLNRRAEEPKESWTEFGVLFSFLWLCSWAVSCSGLFHWCSIYQKWETLQCFSLYSIRVRVALRTWSVSYTLLQAMHHCIKYIFDTMYRIPHTECYIVSVCCVYSLFSCWILLSFVLSPCVFDLRHVAVFHTLVRILCFVTLLVQYFDGQMVLHFVSSNDAAIKHLQKSFFILYCLSFEKQHFKRKFSFTLNSKNCSWSRCWGRGFYVAPLCRSSSLRGWSLCRSHGKVSETDPSTHQVMNMYHLTLHGDTGLHLFSRQFISSLF